MKTYTVKELNEVLRLHSLWLQKDKNGIKANLSGADLSGADLRGVNLSGANLSGANLRWVNFSDVNLSGANLDDKIISVSRIGSRKDVTHYNYTKDIVFCECWHGTLKEFEKRVKKTHKDNPQYLKEYLRAIKFFKALK